MKTGIPDNFLATDDHRDYCFRKWGVGALADVFLEDFRECFAENGYKHNNWDATFKNFLRRESPEGKFYNVSHWERKLMSAKALENRTKKRTPCPYHPQQVETYTKPATAHSHMQALLRKLRP